jgi:hypothetical protein
MIDYLGLYVMFKNFSILWRCHHCRWRAGKFRRRLGAQGFWAGRDLYRATPTATRNLGFSGPIQITAPFSPLLRHTKGCGGPILTQIFTGLIWMMHRQNVRYICFKKCRLLLIVKTYIHSINNKIKECIPGHISYIEYRLKSSVCKFYGPI